MSQKIKLLLLFIGFFAVPILYTFEFEHFNRTLHVSTLAMIALLIGAAVGIGLGYRWQKTAEDFVGRIRIYAACIISAMLIMPLLASLSNRLLAFRPAQTIQVEFVEESPRYSSRFGVANDKAATASSCITFFYKESELLRIQTRESYFPNAQRGDMVDLPIKKGLWGFEVIPVPQPSG